MKKNQKQDSKTISDAVVEINRAAKALKVRPVVIHIAKELSGSNDRETVYAYVRSHMGDTMGIPFLEIKEDKQ